ncbi:hypothetical protein [Cellulomonas sp. URHD0024]|uniref:hypothetical protein n=1 Tax=Cellulomonas sp. URHD0024 TaxID=1302620 RepID=UPI0003F956FF|nr:hypothetical protein [Cellulomonas sp. URHD0024]
MSWHSDDRTRAQSPWADDDALGANLATAVAGADLYDRVLASADLAFRAHRGMVEARGGLEMDLMLLQLVYDSGSLEASAGVRDRSGGTSRTLVFEGDALSVEVEVETTSIEGQLIPPRPGHVTLRTPSDDVASVDTDDVGYFRFDVRPDGPLRLECSNGEGTCVTQWLPY